MPKAPEPYTLIEFLQDPRKYASAIYNELMGLPPDTELPLDEGKVKKTPKRQQHYGPRDDTMLKLECLRQLREENKYSGKINKGWIIACQEIGIDPETVKKHDPELRKHWYDPNY
jgi:hypothetical protein